MMTNTNDLPIIGILRGITAVDIEPLAEMFIRNRITRIEITMNTNDADKLIGQMIETGGEKLVVGAGTVLNLEDLDKAIKAGAEFIVCPSVLPEVIRECHTKNIPVFPGALTPTEVQKAWELGAEMVKLFPASVFGTSYIKALKGPFDRIKIMAVGGVNAGSIADFFRNGADAVAFGGGIINPQLVKERNFQAIEELLIDFINAYKIAGKPGNEL